MSMSSSATQTPHMKPGGSELKCQRVGVGRLLRADREVERLERQHRAPEQLLRDCQHPRAECQGPHGVAGVPCVLDPMPAVPVILSVVPVEDDLVFHVLVARVAFVVVHRLDLGGDCVDQVGRARVIDDEIALLVPGRELIRQKVLIDCAEGHVVPRDYNRARRCAEGLSGPMPDQPTAADAGTIALGGEITVNRLGFGARWLGRHGEDQAVEVLRRAVEMQVNFIDTADVYGGGGSETLIAKALHPYPDDLVIATKGGQIATADGPRMNGRREYLREACEASLRRLRVDTIDLYQLHAPDPEVPIEESLGALVELQAEGKVRQIGVSNLFRGRIQEAVELAGVVSVQNQYSTADRTNDPDVTACEEAGLVFMPYCPLASGELAAPAKDPATGSGPLGPTPAQLALAWLLQRSESILPIPGTSSLQHLEENVRSRKRDPYARPAREAGLLARACG